MILIQLFMAVTSTGSAELIAVSSIITYDIYQQYINPEATGEDLLKISKYGVIGFGLMMGVLGVILNEIGLSLGWVYLGMGVIIGSAVIPVSCVLMSSQVTGKAAISGAIGGFILAIITWFVVASIDGGEVTIDTLGGDYPMLFGNLVAILSSGVICGIVTFMDPEDYDFEGTRAIAVIDGGVVEYADEKETDEQALTDAYWFAVSWGSGLSLIIVVIWPISLYASGYVFSEGFFTFWVFLVFAWSICASVTIIFLPIYDFVGSYSATADQNISKRNPETQMQSISTGESADISTAGDSQAFK